MRQPADPNRRDFVQTLAALATAPVAMQVVAPETQAQASADPLLVAAEALTDIVRSRHGKDLTPEQVKAIKAGIYRRQYSADLLKKVKLANGDEPTFVFRADVP